MTQPPLIDASDDNYNSYEEAQDVSLVSFFIV